MTTATATHPLFDTPLPYDWQVISVDDIKAQERWSCVAGPFGSSISSKYFVEAGVPVIRGNNLRDDLTRFVPRGFAFVSEEQSREYKAQHVRGGDLVFTCWGTLGQVGLIPDNGPYPEYIISNKQLKLRPNREITDPVYLFFYFACQQMISHILGKAIGAAVPGINLGILKQLPVVLPPLPVQRRIARTLSAYDDLIENNLRRIRILEDISRTLYREWFVEFRFPGYENVRRVPSSLGPVPEGWGVKLLHEACHLTMGQSPKSEFYNMKGDGQPLHQGVTDFGDRFPTDRLFCTAEGRMAETGDILFSVRAPVGRMNVADKKIILGRGLSAIRHRNGHQEFLWEQLRNRFTEDDMMGNGAIFAAVTKDDLRAIELLSPPESVVLSATAHFRPIYSQIATLTTQVTNLRRTRDLLLPRLLSGQITLRHTAA
jgi:type I restriction enzyme S subunit